jgi:hypothetical protein
MAQLPFPDAETGPLRPGGTRRLSQIAVIQLTTLQPGPCGPSLKAPAARALQLRRFRFYAACAVALSVAKKGVIAAVDWIPEEVVGEDLRDQPEDEECDEDPTNHAPHFAAQPGDC